MLALDGIRVIDQTQVMAGPSCSMLLGDMGADVIKVEKPHGGDDIRGGGLNRIGGEAPQFLITNRNKRMEEQIALMRRLWTEPVVDFTGRWHRVDRAGLNPLPVQRPIPVWIGGSVDEALRRIARIADGWFAQHPPNDNGRETFARFRGYLRDAGRDPTTFPIEGRVSIGRIKGGPEEWVSMVVSETTRVGWSIAVVWKMAISCLPKVLRMISRPLDSGA